MWLRAASSNVSAASSPSAILGAPMESFLDRLLADERAAAPRPATQAAAAAAAPVTPPGHPGLDGELPGVPLGPEAPRIAIYDTLTSPPRVIAVEEKDLPALIASLAEQTYHYCREQGGQIPYTVLQELMENLLHACFRDVVVTILDNGQTIRISDHGPGVDDKDRAFQPGFTTATALQRQIIRGVGSGLPVARQPLQILRRVLTVDDQLGGGAVCTIKTPAHAPEPEAAQELERLARDGQARADSADDLSLQRGGGGEARLKGAVLVVNAGPVVGDADGLSVVEDRDHDVAEAGVQEILHEFLEHRVRDLAALLATVVIGLLRQRGDEGRQVLLLHGDHARR